MDSPNGTDVLAADDVLPPLDAIDAADVDRAIDQIAANDPNLALVLRYLVESHRSVNALLAMASEAMANPSKLMKMMGLGF